MRRLTKIRCMWDKLLKAVAERGERARRQFGIEMSISVFETPRIFGAILLVLCFPKPSLKYGQTV